MKHKKLFKRVTALLMAAIMFMTNPFQGFSSPTKVKAAEFVLGTEALSEAVLILYSLFETSIISAGNRKGFSSVDKGFDLLNIYNDVEFEKYSALDAAGQALYEETALKFKMVMDNNAQTLIATLLPTGLKIYNAVTNETTMVDIFEEGTNHFKSEFKDKIIDYQNWKSSNAEQPEENNEYQFTVINGTGGMKNFGNETLLPFISLLFKDLIEAAPDSSYRINDTDGGFYPTAYYDQVLRPNIRYDTNSWNLWVTTNYLSKSDARTNIVPTFDGKRYFLVFTNNANLIAKQANPNTTLDNIKNYCTWNVGEAYALSGNYHNKLDGNWQSDSPVKNFYYSNLPVFDSYESALAWLNSDDTSGCINLCHVDLDATLNNASTVYNDLNDDLFYDPSSVIAAGAALNATLLNADLSGNINDNTDLYKSLIAASLAANGFNLSEGESNPNPGEQELPYNGILGSILSAIKAIAGSIWSFFEEILNFIRDLLQTISDDLKQLRQIFIEVIADPIVGAIEALQEAVLEQLAKLAAGGDGMGTEIYEDSETGAHHRSTIITLANGLFLLLAILLALLRLFIHCLLFIFNIFRIPSSTAFLPDNVILGLEYLKQLEIPGIGISVYGLFMGLIYILVFCCVIGVLRAYISRMRVPR